MTPSLKTISWNLRAMIVPGIAVIAMLMTISPVFAGGKWARVTKPAPVSGLCNPLLLTDGTVIVLNCVTSNWYKLTPDSKGDYEKGSWSTIASLPSGYGPEWFASAVLPDGRVIVMGGEYNSSCTATPGQTWTSLGAIYDPTIGPMGTWTPVLPPTGSGWTNTDSCGSGNYNGGIGDAPSIVLPNGQFMLSACCADPAIDALLDPMSLTWSNTGAPMNPCQALAVSQGFCTTAGTPFQEEQGYTLLPNGKVLTISVWNPPNAELYDPGTGVWSAAASTPVPLPDAACGLYEIGPAVTRPDGTVVAFSSHISCTPTPTSPTAIYTPTSPTVSSDSWIQGPNVPSICGPSNVYPPQHCNLADAPAAMLPNGNILFAASVFNLSPTHFFEFTSATSRKPNSIDQVAEPPAARHRWGLDKCLNAAASPLRRRHTSTPLSFGIMTSSKIRSGESVLAAVSASSPSAAWHRS